MFFTICCYLHLTSRTDKEQIIFFITCLSALWHSEIINVSFIRSIMLTQSINNNQSHFKVKYLYPIKLNSKQSDPSKTARYCFLFDIGIHPFPLFSYLFSHFKKKSWPSSLSLLYLFEAFLNNKIRPRVNH